MSHQTVRIPCPDTHWISAKSKALLGILLLRFLCYSPREAYCLFVFLLSHSPRLVVWQVLYATCRTELLKPQQAAKGVPNNPRISAGPLFEEPEDLYGGPLVMDLDKRTCRSEDPEDYQRLVCARCASVVRDALGKYLPECSLLATGFPRRCFSPD